MRMNFENYNLIISIQKNLILKLNSENFILTNTVLELLKWNKIFSWTWTYLKKNKKYIRVNLFTFKMPLVLFRSVDWSFVSGLRKC